MGYIMLVACVFLASICFDQQIDESADYSKGVEGEEICKWVRAFESTGFSGSILAAKNGEVVAAVGTGFCDLERTKPITPSSLFELASISKPITSMCILKLAEQKKISLDDPISMHLAEVPSNCSGIVVRHLLQHTSGMRYQTSEEVTNEYSIAKFLAQGPQNAPGESFQYWNPGYAILSELIGQSSGIDYVEFCRRNVFEPAGMKSTCFTGDVPPVGVSVTVGESSFGEPRSALAHPYGAFDLRYRGMGGIVSNVWDLWRLECSLNDDSIITPASKETMFKPELNDYALGWLVTSNSHGQLVHFHKGFVRGFNSILIRYPESKGFIVVLCNSSDILASEMCGDIENLLYSRKPGRTLPPSPLDKELRKSLVGVYRDNSGKVATIAINGNVTNMLVLSDDRSWHPRRGALGIGVDGKVVLSEGPYRTELSITKSLAGKVESILFAKSEFKPTDNASIK